MDQGKTGCAFAARLHPVGRGSTDADWTYLGEVCAAVGMPQVALEKIEAQARREPSEALSVGWWEQVA